MWCYWTIETYPTIEVRRVRAFEMKTCVETPHSSCVDELVEYILEVISRAYLSKRYT
jgi:hypothetical protein